MNKVMNRMCGASTETQLVKLQRRCVELVGVGLGMVKHGGGIRKFKMLLRKRSFRKWRKQPSDENRSCYNRDKKKAKKVIANAMMCAAEKELDETENNKNVIFRKIRIMKKDSCDITSGNCLKDKNGKICILQKTIEEEFGKGTWKPL